MTPYKNLINELKRISNDSKFDDFFHLLSEGNYNIKIYIENRSDMYGDHTLPLGFFYDKGYIEPGNEYDLLMKNKNRISSRRRISKDAENIGKNLIRLSEMGFFNELISALDEYEFNLNNKLKTGHIQTDDEELREFLLKEINDRQIDRFNDFGSSIITSIKDIIVLEIEPDRVHFDSEWLARNIEKYLNSKSKESKILIIPDQNWFDNLSQKTKKLITSGTQYLEKFYFEQELILDYTPLLLNFIKACESAIIQHVKKYKSEILRNARTLIKEERLIPQNGKNPNPNSTFDSRNLYKVLESIIGHINNYRPNGIKPIYSILKYVALCNDIPIKSDDNINTISIIKSYLPDDKFKHLLTSEEMLNRFKNLSYDRNSIIHEPSMIQLEENFQSYYKDMGLLLKLLAKLNS
jgi:hypothetical protein